MGMFHSLRHALLCEVTYTLPGDLSYCPGSSSCMSCGKESPREPPWWFQTSPCSAYAPGPCQQRSSDPSAPPHPPTPPLCSWRAQRILSWTSLGFDPWYPSSSQNRRWSSSPPGPRPILRGALALGGSFLLTQLKSRAQTPCPHQPGPGHVLLLKQGGPCGHRYHPVRKAALSWGHSQVRHGASEYPPQH